MSACQSFRPVAPFFFFSGKSIIKKKKKKKKKKIYIYIYKGVWPYRHAHDVPLVTLIHCGSKFKRKLRTHRETDKRTDRPALYSIVILYIHTIHTLHTYTQYIHTYLGVAVYPVGSFAVIVTFLQPELQVLAQDG